MSKLTECELRTIWMRQLGEHIAHRLECHQCGQRVQAYERQPPRTVFSDLATVQHDEDFAPIPASEPTDALCGSRAKIEVMRQRVERGECLFHRNDNCEAIAPQVPRVYVPGIREPCVDSRFAMAED